MQRWRTQSGFTLVELITVIVVMSLLVGIGSARMVSSDTFDTRANLGMLVSTLRYAQKTAIAQHRTVYLKLDTTSRTASVCYDASCTSVLADPVSAGPYTQTYSSNVSMSASQSVLGFDANGAPVPNANATYVVVNAKNAAQSNTVQVEAYTGYARVL